MFIHWSISSHGGVRTIHATASVARPWSTAMPKNNRQLRSRKGTIRNSSTSAGLTKARLNSAAASHGRADRKCRPANAASREKAVNWPWAKTRRVVGQTASTPAQNSREPTVRFGAAATVGQAQNAISNRKHSTLTASQ